MAGPHDPAEIIRSVNRGLYVTELIGQGVNLVTGDYSRGAVGFWIDKGELTYPVEEITVAGNDLTSRNSVLTRTLEIHRTTVPVHQPQPTAAPPAVTTSTATSSSSAPPVGGEAG